MDEKKEPKKMSFSAGQRFSMRDGVEYITSDRGEFIRLTPRLGRKSRRRSPNHNWYADRPCFQDKLQESAA